MYHEPVYWFRRVPCTPQNCIVGFPAGVPFFCPGGAHSHPDSPIRSNTNIQNSATGGSRYCTRYMVNIRRYATNWWIIYIADLL